MQVHLIPLSLIHQPWPANTRGVYGTKATCSILRIETCPRFDVHHRIGGNLILNYRFDFHHRASGNLVLNYLRTETYPRFDVHHRTSGNLILNYLRTETCPRFDFHHRIGGNLILNYLRTKACPWLISITG